MVAGGTAVVLGASGGIGRALVDQLEARGAYAPIHALSRTPGTSRGRVIDGFADITDEASLADAAGRIGAPIALLIIATGMLHDTDAMPEKALRDLDGVRLAKVFAVNTIGPALALKYFGPLLARDRRSVMAALSARVGSISDNRSGGWYGYRASKAALNMIVKTASIELARSRPQAICVALHPGTVDTRLSEPFQARVPPEQLFSTDRAAGQLLDVLDCLDVGQSGRVIAWDGREIVP